MSIPVQMCEPTDDGDDGVVEEMMDPDRPEPQPMSRMWEGFESWRRERARWVISAWMCCMRLEVVYFAAEVVL